MWFVLERLDPMPVDALLDAGRMLVRGLRKIAPELALSVQVFDAGNAKGEPLAGL